MVNPLVTTGRLAVAVVLDELHVGLRCLCQGEDSVQGERVLVVDVGLEVVGHVDGIGFALLEERGLVLHQVQQVLALSL